MSAPLGGRRMQKQLQVAMTEDNNVAIICVGFAPQGSLFLVVTPDVALSVGKQLVLSAERVQLAASLPPLKGLDLGDSL